MSRDELSEESRQLNLLPLEDQAIRTPALFSVWAKQDPSAALTEAKRLKHLKNEMISMILAEWSTTDPVAAAEFYKINEASLFTRNYMEPWNQVSGSSVIIRGLIENGSTETAFQWAETLGNVADRNTALNEVYYQLAAQSPEEAVDLLPPLPGGERDYGLRGIAAAWAERDVEEAINWANTLSSMDREHVLPAIISGLASRDPLAAAQLINYIPNSNHDAAIETVITPWAQQDPMQAANWLVTERSVEEQTYFIEPVLSQWIDRNPAAAKSWVQNLAEGDARDEAVLAYVNTTKSGLESHTELFDMIETGILNPAKKEKAKVSVLVSLAAEDPETAKQAALSSLSGSGISDYLHQTGAQEPLD
ncbi:hypothetical protein EGM51_08475 [Verrucomicrobia bacterium S94]|nr:hypothetical protein EGM51_08475 [Verrucomicrobia bacterium S94]